MSDFFYIYSKNILPTKLVDINIKIFFFNTMLYTVDFRRKMIIQHCTNQPYFTKKKLKLPVNLKK